MILNNLYIIGNGEEKKSIKIKNSVIQRICEENEIDKADDIVINFENALVFPGLINSHDHLEFSLYPPLGNKTYKDYIEWGDDIHKVNKAQIESILRIPEKLRYKWGIYKNLLPGITTVFQHGKIINDPKDNIIDVYNGGKIFHSVKLEKYWKLRINLPNPGPIVIHIGEGINTKSSEEIKILNRWNFLKKEVIGIHAIALKKEDAENFKAIIWCPASNYFLFNKTADISEIKEKTKILFGTDSSVSANGNIWDHLRFARKLKLINDNNLFDALTATPAEIWDLKSLGILKETYQADLVFAEKKFDNLWDSFFSIEPEDIILIIKKGKIIYFDDSIDNQLNFFEKDKKLFTKIKFCGKKKHIYGNLNELINSIHQYNSEVQFPFEIINML
jgi:cytosine/adenosine deaminase-related metal-dependent hydrolase